MLLLRCSGRFLLSPKEASNSPESSPADSTCATRYIISVFLFCELPLRSSHECTTAPPPRCVVILITALRHYTCSTSGSVHTICCSVIVSSSKRLSSFPLVSKERNVRIEENLRKFSGSARLIRYAQSGFTAF